jgi:hypothetical protein
MSMKRLLLAAFLLPLVAACKGNSTGGQPVGSVTLSQSQAFVAVGDTVRLTVSVLTPEGTVIQNPRVQWQSTNQTVATVDNGLVTGRAAGSAQIIATAGSMSDTTALTVIAAGALRTFNVNPNSACGSPVNVQARRVAATANAHFYHDLRNPAGVMTDADYQQLANRFQAEQYGVLTANFGQPSDLDGNGAVVVLYTRAVNELTPANVGYVIGGFFYARDLYPRVATQRLGSCPGSNEAEMFYMLAEDPDGEINGNRRNADMIRRGLGTLGHEFQHLINASRRLHVNLISPVVFEETWLDEGLSHIAEELVFYNVSGLAPRQNLDQSAILANDTRRDAFNDYAIQNFLRLRSWMQGPATRSPYGNEDDLQTRGAAWSFLRYGADRRAGNDQQLWFSLVNSSTRGFDNLNQALGIANPLPWFQDWGVAMYTDDAVPGVAARFTHPSWNFRNVYLNQAFGSAFPLAVQTLAAGTPLNLSVRAGSSAYVRFGVAPATQADVRVTATGTSHDGPCTVLNLTVGQVHQVDAAALPAFCVAGGATGGDYVLIPFHASPANNAFVDFTVTGTGIVAPVGPPTPDQAVQPRFSRGPELVWDHEFERRLRQREREELEPLIRDRAVRTSTLADLAPAAVRYSLVRTR